MPENDELAGTRIIRHAVGSLTAALQSTAMLDAGSAQQIAQCLLEPDADKRHRCLVGIECQHGPRAIKAIDEAFGTWLMQYQADPAQPEERTDGR